jgi:hypothetical protein
VSFSITNVPAGRCAQVGACEILKVRHNVTLIACKEQYIESSPSFQFPSFLPRAKMSSNTDIGGPGATKKLRMETEGTLDAQTEAPAVEPIFDFEFTLVNVDKVITDLVMAKKKWNWKN